MLSKKVLLIKRIYSGFLTIYKNIMKRRDVLLPTICSVGLEASVSLNWLNSFPIRVPFISVEVISVAFALARCALSLRLHPGRSLPVSPRGSAFLLLTDNRISLASRVITFSDVCLYSVTLALWSLSLVL